MTVHHQDPRWIELQYSQFQRHITQPYKVWASLEGIPEEYAHYFDVVVPSVGKHEGKLNLLAAEVAANQSAEDLIMFIDGDAFLTGDPGGLCEIASGCESLLAVRRLENAGDTQPHPCFAIMSVDSWVKVRADWSSGYPWINECGELVSDVGGNMQRALELANKSWRGLYRSNIRNLHPLFFGLYGNTVYHHGAGFRRVISRVDLENLLVPDGWRGRNRIKKAAHQVSREVRARQAARLSEAMLLLLRENTRYAIDFLRGEDYVFCDPKFRTLLRIVLNKADKLRWSP